MLSLTLALALHLGTVDAAPAPSTPADASTPSAAGAPRSASLAPREERHKSFNPLIGTLEFVVGAAAGYVGVLAGVLYNIGQGGLQWPPDAGDILLLGVLPAVMAAGGSWLIGLMDSSQRSVLGSLLHALLGGLVGQAAGLGVGYLIGRAVAGPDDLSGAMAISVFIAPAFAALGAVLFMELFKPGELRVSASLAPLRDAGGVSGLAPAVALRW
ncbi:MAG: hypothetical protein AB1938_13370 [Myxococcota bacterium]